MMTRGLLKINYFLRLRAYPSFCQIFGQFSFGLNFSHGHVAFSLVREHHCFFPTASRLVFKENEAKISSEQRKSKERSETTDTLG